MSNHRVISKKHVHHIATLANLSISETEAETYANQLGEILTYVEQLDEVETEGIEPTFQVIDGTTNVLRDDIAEPGLTQEEALSQASNTHEGYFVVERILQDE